MIKKCLFLLCALFVVQIKSDCSDDFLKCFSEFAESFFQNITEVEHVNASADSLPKDYKQVKDVEIKTIADALQNDFFKQFKTHVATDVVVTDNPKTKIYVKSFSYDFGDSFIPGLENVNSSRDETTAEVEVQSFSPFGLKTVNGGEVNDANEQFTSGESSTKPSDILKSNRKTNNDEAQGKNSTDKNNVHKLVSTSTGKALILTEKSNLNIDNRNKTSHINKQEHKLSAPTTESSNSNALKIKEVESNKDLTTDRNIEKHTKYEQKNLSTKLNPTHDTQDLKEKEPINDKPTIISNNDKISDANNEKQISEEQPVKAKPNNGQTYFTGKQFEKDIRENLIDDENDYDTDDATDYPQIDYIDLYKDTTNEENVYVPTDSPKVNIKDEIIENIEEYSLEIETEWENDTSTNICHGNTSDVSNIYPWIAAIFIKNDTAKNQFQYVCDGALLSDKLLLTAARCVHFFNSTVEPDDVLVFLGKRSLQTMAEGEKTLRISKIILHMNFSMESGKVSNDLALLVLEEPVIFTTGIRPACVGPGGTDDLGKSATTSWNPTGALTPVFFVKNGCSAVEEDGAFCATYGNEVALCPSYGGIFATKRAGRWYLHGIRTGDVSIGICHSKEVSYTPLEDHQNWIMENMEQ